MREFEKVRLGIFPTPVHRLLNSLLSFRNDIPHSFLPIKILCPVPLPTDWDKPLSSS